MLPTITDLAVKLEAGEITSRELIERCLERIEDPEGEGGRCFVKVSAGQARAAADAIYWSQRDLAPRTPELADSGTDLGRGRP